MATRCRASLLAIACALAPAAQAQLLVLDAPPRVTARGVDLQRGDRLLAADGGALDLAGMRRLETVEAAAVPVELSRERGGQRAPLILPVGAWDLELLPDRDPQASGRDELLSAYAADDADAAQLALTRWIGARLAAGADVDGAEGLMLRAQQLGRAGDWRGAEADLARATARMPSLEADYIEALLRCADLRPDRHASLALAERALALRELQPESSRRTWALLLRARSRSLLRDNEGSRADALAIIALGHDDLVAAQARMLLGFAAMRGGRRDEAASEFAAARARLEVLAPGSVELALVLGQQGTLAGIQSQPDALERIERALVLMRRVGPQLGLRGGLAFNAHLIALQRRRFAAAETYARESLEVYAAVAPGSLPEAQARTALADVLMRRTQYDEAETLFRAALAQSERIDASSYETLSTRVQLGQTLAAQGRTTDALAEFDAVIAAVALSAADSALRTTNLMLDAQSFRVPALLDLGRLDEAEAAGVDALEHYVASGRGDTVQAETLTVLADTARLRGQLPLAHSRAETAIARWRQIAPAGIQEGAAHFVLARSLREAGDIDGALREYAAAIDGLERHREVVGGSDEIRARWAAQFQDFYKEPLMLLARRGDAAGSAALERRYRAQALLRLLDSDAAVPAGWAADDHALDPAAALAADQALLSLLIAPEGVVALVWTPGVALPQVFAIDLPSAQLDASIRRLRLLAERVPDDPSSAQAFDRASFALYSRLLGPLQPLLGRYPRWVLVADGALRQLPWAALAIDAGTRPRRLVEDHALLSSASPAVFALSRSAADANGTVLGFADVDVALAPRRDPLRHPDLATALPGARREIDALGDLYGTRATSFVGRAASEAAVRSHASTASLLHFAVHGVLDSRDPMRSFLALARGSEALADDGMLSAQEIADGLHVPGSLVVLSSCESALGGDVGGEGLLGLSRAFGVAGAGAVLGTLWRVSDRATAQLMSAFHHGLRGGLAADVALAQAQRQWLARVRGAGWGESLRRAAGLDDALPVQADHPFYWAAFALDGGAGAR